MIDSTMQLLTGFPFDGTIAWTAGWLIRGSLFLFLLVLLAGPLARARSSSVRHLLWAAGFAAVVALPVASVGLPRLEVRVPASVLPSSPTLVSSPSSLTEVIDGTVPVVSHVSSEFDSASPFPEEGGVAGGEIQDRRAGWDLSSLTRVVFVVWLVGAVLLLLRFAASMVRTEGIVHRGNRVSRPEWERTLFDLSDRMDLGRAPHLIVSDEVALPMTCGTLRPTIVLPPSAAEWSHERIEAVLCHELAHIRRRDLLSHALGHIGSALYWVNPLAWKAARSLRAECERACDDLVLSLGYRPSVYADHLLQIATCGHRANAPVAALPMARPGEFEQRLLSILAPIVDRSHLKGWRAVAVAVGVLAFAVPFAVLAPAAATASVGRSAEESPLAVSAEQDTILTMSVEVHLPDPHPNPDPDHIVMNSPNLGVHISGLNAGSCSGCSGSGSGSGFGAGSGSMSNSDFDVHASLNLDGLAAFVHGVTSFASAVATEAMTSALSDLRTSVSVSVGAEGQDRVEGSFERTLSLSGPLQLEIGTGSGGIDIREGNVDRVEIRGTVRVSNRNRGNASAEAVLRRLIASPPIEQSGNEVRIGRIDDRSLQDGVTISYELVVPVRSAIVANTGSGGVDISGIQGDVRAATGSGSIDLASIRGEVYTRTGSGSIRASQITGPFDGGTGSGSIDLTLQGAGNVSLSTGSGSVSASGVRGALRAVSGSGGIDVDGEMRGPWELQTGSGSVTVNLPAQAAFSLVARAGSGSVDIDHPITMMGRIDPKRQEVIGTVRGGGPELNIRTGSGGIRID